MNSKSYLLSFAKAKGNMAAVALAAVLMAANATVASAQNKATENNGTEKTVIGGVDDLYGIDPSKTYCTTNHTNEIDGNKIVYLYNVGAKKFLSVGGMWGNSCLIGCYAIFHLYVLECKFKNVLSGEQGERFCSQAIYGNRHKV
jgi:hypothetical protein